jgi:aerobic-type carbon monoxide dehydrogenase small subunit (CoxS/CutS family)
VQTRPTVCVHMTHERTCSCTGYHPIAQALNQACAPEEA